MSKSTYHQLINLPAPYDHMLSFVFALYILWIFLCTEKQKKAEVHFHTPQ